MCIGFELTCVDAYAYQCHFLEPKYKNNFYRKIDCDIQTNLKNKSLALDLGWIVL